MWSAINRWFGKKPEQTVPLNEHIKHVVVLMLENHSFDQVLGAVKSAPGYEGLEGVDVGDPRSNIDPCTKDPLTQASTELMSIDFDPRHEHLNVMRQIADQCGGFVADFSQCYSKCTAEERAQIMAYYRLGSLPVIHTLALNFTICDHWFSSMPGPTWQNRFFVHSGTSKGHVIMPSGLYIRNEHCYDQNTIYDLLEAKKISWAIYHHGMPQSLTLEHLWDKFDHYHRIEVLYADAKGPAGKFPAYAFIEPSYGGADQNDQHPPTDMRKGEYLIAQVYNALRSNEELWNSTLLVLLYDEHGGFYDHVYPPKTVAPDEHTSEFSFDQYGVRVPAILISPWVRKGINSTVFDHTSLLRFLIDGWGLEANSLGKRVANASTFTSELNRMETARTDTPPIFDLPSLPLPKPVPPPQQTNELQTSLVAFSHFLETKMAHVEELAAVGYRSLKSLDGALEQLSVARDRFLLFFHHGQKGRLDPL
jgi:phospholipase C